MEDNAYNASSGSFRDAGDDAVNAITDKRLWPSSVVGRGRNPNRLARLLG
jgi:hypothetical protein